MQTMLLGLGLDLSQVHEFANLLQTRGRFRLSAAPSSSSLHSEAAPTSAA